MKLRIGVPADAQGVEHAGAPLPAVSLVRTGRASSPFAQLLAAGSASSSGPAPAPARAEAEAPTPEALDALATFAALPQSPEPAVGAPGEGAERKNAPSRQNVITSTAPQTANVETPADITALFPLSQAGTPEPEGTSARPQDAGRAPVRDARGPTTEAVPPVARVELAAAGAAPPVARFEIAADEDPRTSSGTPAPAPARRDSPRTRLTEAPSNVEVAAPPIVAPFEQAPIESAVGALEVTAVAQTPASPPALLVGPRTEAAQSPDALETEPASRSAPELRAVETSLVAPPGAQPAALVFATSAPPAREPRRVLEGAAPERSLTTPLTVPPAEAMGELVGASAASPKSPSTNDVPPRTPSTVATAITLDETRPATSPALPNEPQPPRRAIGDLPAPLAPSVQSAGVEAISRVDAPESPVLSLLPRPADNTGPSKLAVRTVEARPTPDAKTTAATSDRPSFIAAQRNARFEANGPEPRTAPTTTAPERARRSSDRPERRVAGPLEQSPPQGVAELKRVPREPLAPEAAPDSPRPPTRLVTPTDVALESTPARARLTPVARLDRDDVADQPAAEPTSPTPAPSMVLPPTFSVVAAKASPPSPTAEDIGTKRDELKGRAVERPAGAEALATPLLPRPPAILELAAQRAAAPPVEPRRTKAEAPALESVMAAGSEPKRDVEKKDRDELTALGRPTAAPAPAELAPSTRLEVASAAPPVPNVTPAMLEDPSLRVVVLPTLARVNVETADQGSLALQVRVQDGVTDIRAIGPAASLIESRQGELRVALANEGLALGHFDLGQSDSGGRRERFETPEERDFAPRRSPLRAVSGSTTRADGRLSVKA